MFLFANNATSILTGTLGSGSTSIGLPAGEGARFPNPTGGDVFMVTLEDRRTGQIEICRCTSRSADLLTVVRAQEGTTAQAFAAGSSVSNRITAGTAAAFQSGVSDPELAALAALNSAVDTLPYFTGSATADLTAFTSTARTLLSQTSEANIRTMLGVRPGTDVQIHDPQLTALAALSPSTDQVPYFSNATTAALATFAASARALCALSGVADRLPYFNGTNTAALATFTQAARDLLDDTTAGAMLTTLGAQPLDAELTALAGLTSANNTMPYFTGVGTAATTPLTSQARQLLDDTSFPTMLATLGAQATHANLTALSGLAGATDTIPYFSGGSGAMAAQALTSAARALFDDANADAMLATLGGTTLGQALFKAANAAAALTSLGVTSFGQSLIDDANAGAALTTLGIAAFAQTLLDDASANAARNTMANPVAFAHRSGANNATAANGSWSIIPMGTLANTKGFTLSGGSLIVPETGYYSITASAAWAAVASQTQWLTGISINGATPTRYAQYYGLTANQAQTLQTTHVASLAANDTIDLACRAGGATGTIIDTNPITSLSAHRVS